MIQIEVSDAVRLYPPFQVPFAGMRDGEVDEGWDEEDPGWK